MIKNVKWIFLPGFQPYLLVVMDSKKEHYLTSFQQEKNNVHNKKKGGFCFILLTGKQITVM